MHVPVAQNSLFAAFVKCGYVPNKCMPPTHNPTLSRHVAETLNSLTSCVGVDTPRHSENVCRWRSRGVTVRHAVRALLVLWLVLTNLFLCIVAVIGSHRSAHGRPLLRVAHLHGFQFGVVPGEITAQKQETQPSRCVDALYETVRVQFVCDTKTAQRLIASEQGQGAFAGVQVPMFHVDQLPQYDRNASQLLRCSHGLWGQSGSRQLLSLEAWGRVSKMLCLKPVVCPVRDSMFLHRVWAWL